MNRVLIEHIVDSISEDWPQDEVVAHIVAELNCAEWIGGIMADLQARQTRLTGIHENDFDLGSDINRRYDYLNAQITRTLERQAELYAARSQLVAAREGRVTPLGN